MCYPIALKYGAPSEGKDISLYHVWLQYDKESRSY